MTTVPAARLEKVLEQSHEVKEKVEECADDLETKNDAVEQKIAKGAKTLPADEVLQDSEAVEATVKEVAADLKEVTATLAKGVADVQEVEVVLTRSRAELAQLEAALRAAQEAERQAALRALHDPATGLPNRVLFDDRMTQALSLAERQGWMLAVMFLDLDAFKGVNDGHGHAAGDLVLRHVAGRLVQHARDEDTVCRAGGDEFLYLLVNPKCRADVERKAVAVLGAVAQPIDVEGSRLVIRASIGIALYPTDGATADELIRNADTAMYRAKTGGGGYVVYGSEKAIGPSA